MVGPANFLGYLLRTAVIRYHKYGVERSAKHVHHSYDFLIVGGGTGGAIVTAKLSKIQSVSMNYIKLVSFNKLLIESRGSGSHIIDIPFIASFSC